MRMKRIGQNMKRIGQNMKRIGQKQWQTFFGLALLLGLLVTGEMTAHAQTRSESRVQPYAANPFYWQYQGEPVLLLGGSDDDDIHSWNAPELASQLDLLVANGGNFLRDVVTSSDVTNLEFPFRQITSGPNAGQFDLNEWDETWWSRMDNLLQQTNERDIIVSFEIWNGFGFNNANWGQSPWNPRNNINYTSAETGIPEVWTTRPRSGDSPFVETVPGQDDVPQVLAFQERFVREFLRRSLPYDNALYVIQNESSTNFDWSDYWANVLHEEAAMQGENVEVADMRFPVNLTDPDHEYPIDRPDLYTFTDISQNTFLGTLGGVTLQDQQQYDRIQFIRDNIQFDSTLGGGPPVIRPINNAKIYGADGNQGVFFGTTENGVGSFWRNIFGGAASVRFHRPGNNPDRPFGLGLSPVAQTQILSARMVTEAIDIFSTEPRNDLLSSRTADEAYVLTDAEQEYAVYFPGDGNGSVVLDLASAPTAWRLQWLDVDASTWGASTLLGNVESVTLQRPNGGQWVALIVAVPEPGALLLGLLATLCFAGNRSFMGNRDF